MNDWILISIDLFNQSDRRIIWNLFLAFIPAIVSYFLFSFSAKRNLLWWILLIIFLAFLPNAPYVLTDSIHIIELSQKDYPLWAIIFILIPQYLLFITTGFGAYAISLIRLDRYLADLIEKQYIFLINGVLHFLCTIGIYIGRFERFNSWDLVVKPGMVILTVLRNLLDLEKLSSIIISFFLIWLLAEFIKLVNRSFALSQSSNN